MENVNKHRQGAIGDEIYYGKYLESRLIPMRIAAKELNVNLREEDTVSACDPEGTYKKVWCEPNFNQKFWDRVRVVSERKK